MKAAQFMRYSIVKGMSLFEPVGEPALEQVQCVLCRKVVSGTHFGRNGHARKHIDAGEAQKVDGRHVVGGAP